MVTYETWDYLDHLNSLEELHGVIARQHDPGAQEAMAGLITDVEVATAAIAKNVEGILDEIHSKAETAREKITTGTSASVTCIKQETTKAAARLLRDVEVGEDEKSAARAAGRIIEEASVTSIDLEQRAEKAVTSITEKMIIAVANVNMSLENGVRELVELGRNAVRKADLEVKEVPAGIIESLAWAKKEIKRVAKQAAAKLNKAGKEAVKMVEKAAREAKAAINRVIENANKKIFETTEQAIAKAVGAEKVEFFDLDNLRKKWGKKDK